MSYLGEDGYDYHRRRRSPRGYYEEDRRAQFLNPGAAGGLNRARSTGHAPRPVINNIYVDQVQDAHLRAASPYRGPPPPPPPPAPVPSSPRVVPVPYPASPEMRGRRMLGEDLLREEMAEMMLRDRLHSRSRGRTEASLRDRPDFAEWRLEQREREMEEDRNRQLWEKEEELRRLKADRRRERSAHQAEEEKDRVIREYEEKNRRAAEAAKAESKRLEDERKRAVEEYEEKKRRAAAHAKEEERRYDERRRQEAADAKAEEQRIKEKLDREEREAKEREKSEYDEFLRKQKEKAEKEKAEKAAEKEKIDAEMRRRLARLGYTEAQIEMMVDEEKVMKHQVDHGRPLRGPSPVASGAMRVWGAERAPVYAKIHREYLDVDTLRYYDIPYEFDRFDPNYLIILREMDKYETEVLFEHTKRLRSGRLLLEASPKDGKNYAFYRKRDRSTSRVKKVGILEVRRVV